MDVGGQTVAEDVRAVIDGWDVLDLLDAKIYVKDRHSRFLYMNRYCADEMRIDDPASVIGKSDADYFTSEHADVTRRVEAEILASGKGICNVLEHETWHDRRHTWVLSSKFPLRNRAGRIVGLIGISKDVTDAINTERAYEHLLDEIPDLIWVKNSDLEFTFVNRALAQLFKQCKSEIYGKKDQQFLGITQELHKIMKDDMEVLATGEPKVISETLTVDGSPTKRLRTYKVRLPGPDAPPESKLQILGIAHDVTGLLQESRDHHEQFIARTISHSLKGWVAVIDGAIFALKLRQGDSPDMQRLQRAATYVRHATHVATLLEALQKESAFNQFSIDELVQGIMGAITDPRVEVGATFPNSMIWGSQFHVGNALLELVTNAIDFAPPAEAGGKIEVWIEYLPAQHRCEIHVRDNGPGVDPALGEAIFELCRSSQDNRTGMGLAYVKRVAESHKGTIRYEPGVLGAHFLLTIPLFGIPT